ncbi:MAG TPA: TetR/AcrR family transcriptional regulator [Kribbella sp.]
MAVTPVRERTRREIQQQAMALFGEKGYQATSLQDIATAAGCSKATVLYHFNGKPAVLAAVVEPAAANVTALVDEASRLAPTQAQELAITGFVDLAVRFRGLLTVLNEVIPTMPQLPEFHAMVADGQRLAALLAGGDDPYRLGLAGFAISGLLGECRSPHHRSDDELRDICGAAMRRLLIASPGQT